jgi:hypothetical protein
MSHGERVHPTGFPSHLRRVIGVEDYDVLIGANSHVCIWELGAPLGDYFGVPTAVGDAEDGRLVARLERNNREAPRQKILSQG